MATTIKLGALLVKTNLLTETQLAGALAEQKRWGGKLGEILVRMNVITEDLLVRALAKQLNIPAANVDGVKSIEPHVLAKIPPDVARDLTVLPLQLLEEGKTLVVAMSEPQNLAHIDTLRSITRCKIIAQIAGSSAISRAFARLFDTSADVSDGDGPYKFVDAQGNTMLKSIDEVMASKPAAAAAAPSRPAPPPPANEGPPVTTRHVMPRPSASDVPAPRAGGLSPSEQLAQMEESHRKEVAALKAMIELLIEKGFFSRDEYLAKVRK